MLAHRLCAAGDLVGGLALHTQSDEEGTDLSGRRRALHDPVHHLAGMLPREIAPFDHGRERLLDHLRSRKFLASRGPSGVSTDSGWNWTPSTLSVRWRTAITSPSSAYAVGSSTSGNRVAASEW